MKFLKKDWKDLQKSCWKVRLMRPKKVFEEKSMKIHMEQTKNVKKKIVQKTINESLNQSNLTTKEVEQFKSSGKIIASFVLR